MKALQNYRATIGACLTGYTVQAVLNNFVPLLFLTLSQQYNLPLEQITMLITLNFGIQLTVDLCAAVVVDRIGYRVSMIAAHLFSAAGLILLAVLPGLLPHPFAGLLIAVGIYAVGGGVLEVLVSPIVEACPTDNKEKAMSLLHSFYCWGHVGTVLISTGFFCLFGMENWRILALLWAILPLTNALVFTQVPIASLQEEGKRGLSLRELLSKKVFWLLLLMMLCAGASEQAVSQWASAFAEKGLGVSKAVGDLAGPMAFAAFMGASRAFYGKYGDRIRLDSFMAGSVLLCLVSYLAISLIPAPLPGLIGCAVCGLSVGILWPGTFSRAAVALRDGGTAMFALLALAGDVGCLSGPTVVGLVSGASGSLHTGILAAVIFPVLMLLCLLAGRGKSKKKG